MKALKFLFGFAFLTTTFHPLFADFALEKKFKVPFEKKEGEDLLYRVSQVLAGDVLLLSTGENVRMLGISVPERARAFVERYVFDNDCSGSSDLMIRTRPRKISLEFDELNILSHHRDSSDRLLATVWVEVGLDPLTGEPNPSLCTEEFEPVNPPKKHRVNLSAQLMREGYARASNIFPTDHFETLRRLGEEAKKSGRGLWEKR